MAKNRARIVRRHGRKVDQNTYRIHHGKEVKPVLLAIPNAKGTGHRNRMCGQIDGEIVRDAIGNPVSYQSIPNER